MINSPSSETSSSTSSSARNSPNQSPTRLSTCTSATRLANTAIISTAKNVKATLTGMKGHLTRQIKKCNDLCNQTPVDYVELEGHYKVAESKYQHVQMQILKYHDILATTNIDEAAMEAVVQEDTDYEDTIQTKLQHFDSLITIHKANTNIAATASQNLTQPEVKLPSLSFPTFSGTEDASWDNFWNKFVNSVDSNATIAKTTKFAYLQVVLKDEALKVVCNLTFTDDGYDSAVQLLKDNYAKPERTIRLLTQKLLDISPPDGSADSLQAVRLELESLLKALKNKVREDKSTRRRMGYDNGSVDNQERFMAQ
nr:uncharacterized protein LOC123762181 [Procambarus clarkii]